MSTIFPRSTSHSGYFFFAVPPFPGFNQVAHLLRRPVGSLDRKKYLINKGKSDCINWF